MIVAVAVCPGAPLLVPGLAPGLATVAQDLVDSCSLAVATLRDAGCILLLTSGPRARDLDAAARRSFLRHPPGTVVSTATLTDSRLPPRFSGVLAGAGRALPAAAPAGVGVVVGAALLEAAGVLGPTTAVELGGPGSRGDLDGTTGEDLEWLRSAIGGPADRVGLLIIGEGSASRGADSPGGGHDDARTFDAALAGALASGDPAALAAAVTAGRPQASDLLWTAGPALGALSVLCAGRPPTGAELLYADAPFGVGYVVATWTWA